MALPRTPRLPRAGGRLPKITPARGTPAPIDPLTPAVPGLGQPTATGSEERARYQDWGRGTLAEFTIWDYLVNQQHLTEGTDFFFWPSAATGVLSRFYVGPSVWRVDNDGIVPAPLSVSLERSQFENSGYLVVDIDAQRLASDKNAILNQAIQGREPAPDAGGPPSSWAMH